MTFQVIREQFKCFHSQNMILKCASVIQFIQYMEHLWKLKYYPKYVTKVNLPVLELTEHDSSILIYVTPSTSSNQI